MSEIGANPPDPFCYLLISRLGIEQFQPIDPDPFWPRARDTRGRFAKGSSGILTAGRAASPIPSGECPILRPGR
jgi:hypothetical protein